MTTDAPFARVLRVAAVFLAAGGVSSSVRAQQQAPAPQPQAPAAPAPAAPQRVITRIEVVGNQRIETSTILSYVTIREGDTYSAVEADNALKTLMSTGLFTPATRIDLNGSTLIVRVVENPVLNQVVFEGNLAVKSDDLTKEVQLKPRGVFTRAKVQADVQRIINLYRAKGHFAAVVNPQIIQRPQNRVDLIFSINEGQSTGVARINFIGNKVFDDATLRSQIATSENVWWNPLQTSNNYDPDRLTFDGERLRVYYMNHGYADFRLISSTAQLTPDRKNFFITFTIDEGVQYRVGKIIIQSSIKELTPAVLRPSVEIDEGEIYDRSKVGQAIDALTSAAGEKGYAFADVGINVVPNPRTRTLDITFKINQGPRVYIEKIDITGNARTLDKVIRREFRLAEGDAFNRVLVDRSRTRIRSLGLFKEVSVRPTPGSQPDRTNLTVAVQEQLTGELSLGAGFGSGTGFIGEFSYTERNLFGRNQLLRASLQLSTISKQAVFSFTEPWFLDRPLSAGIDIYKTYLTFDRAAYDGDTTAAGVRFGFPTSEYGFASLSYKFVVDTITPFANASAQVFAAQGTTYSSIFGYGFVYSTLDDPELPTKGFTMSFSQEFAGLGGTLKYVRNEAQFVGYSPVLWDTFVGSLEAQAGYITGYDGQNVPINQRYFKGGDSFRGFALGGIGPRDLNVSGDAGAVGGNVFAIGRAELRIPSFLPESYGIRAALFTDFGTLGYLDGPRFGCTAVSCVKDNLAFRAASGLSVSWKSPFGPLTIDFGIPFAKAPYDRTQLIHFGARTG
jgi:outer membrane protein insertion porin family